MNNQSHDGKKEAYRLHTATSQYAVIEKCSGLALEFHKTIESANQSVKRINARWGDGEVFAQQKEVLA